MGIETVSEKQIDLSKRSDRQIGSVTRKMTSKIPSEVTGRVSRRHEG